MKKALLVLVVFFVSAFSLFALEGSVTWIWFENDPNVEYYRYQIDGEDDDKWTVVDWTVTEVTYTLDVTVLHTLYLQQSYDGINWSSSSYTESEIYYEAEESPEDFFGEDLMDDFVSDEVAEQTEENAEDEEDEVIEASVIEDEIILPVVEGEKKYQPLNFLDFGFGYMNSIPDADGPKTVGFNASYSRTFLKAGLFDIGLKVDLGACSSRDLFRFKQWSDGSWMEDWQLQSYVSCLALATTRIGNCDVYGAIGPDFGYTYGKNVSDNAGIAGLELEVGVRYHRFRNVSIGFSFCDHQYLFSLFDSVGMDMANRMELKAFLGFSF